MSNIDKIKFHSLQRFDKKDADDLQKHLYDYLQENVIDGIGLAGGKVSADDISFTYSIPTGRYTLTTEFDYLSSDKQFVTSLNGANFDVTALQTYFTNYLSTNGNLTNADTWYLWARPDAVDSTSESREFFSTINNAAETQTVLTRVIVGSVVAAGTAKPDNDAGWTKVATFKFSNATVNGVNTLLGPEIKALTISDYMSFGLQSIKTPGSKGISTVIFALEEAMRKILSDGTEDLTGTTQTQPGSTPTMSLEGLTKFVKEQTYSKRGHAVLKFSPNPNWPAGAVVDFNDLTDLAPYLAPTVTETYRWSGFDTDVVPHGYDEARFIIPFNSTQLSTLLNDFNIGTNQMQDVNLMFTYEDRDMVDNVQDLFDVPDQTFNFGRSDAMIPKRWVIMHGNNGPWNAVETTTYSTVVNGTNYANYTGIGIYSPLCRARVDTNVLNTRRSPNHDDIVKTFIDYHLTTGSALQGNLVTNVAKYATPPTFEIHIIVKG